VTQKTKADPATLLALGSSLGLQGFNAPPAAATGQRRQQAAPAARNTAAAAASPICNAAAVMALAKAARLQCVADETGAQ
jgi:hypothetical protein